MNFSPSSPLMIAPSLPPRGRSLWERPCWQRLRHAHLGRVAVMADAFVRRRSRGETHPVDDFLFTYYSFSPAKLKQWVPPLGADLEVTEADLLEMPWLDRSPFCRKGPILALDARQISPVTVARARDIAHLCGNVLDRPPRFRCHGLHEWAMVYRQSAEEVRHAGYRLRMPPDELARFVESQPICCSHYDAFRFFTPAARQLNALQPTLEQRPELEQAGCLHTNMDLYKWSAKLWPWTGSDLIGRAFELACHGRNLDMRASPYDLRDIGCAPLPIETPEGREAYVAEQRILTARAQPIRQELLRAAQMLSQAGSAE